MPIWKLLLLNLYYHASSLARARRYRREAAKGSLPAIVLYYHRIADDRANPWTLSNAMFQRQIGWLKERFPLVSLEEAQRRIREGCNRQTCVSITFDDGYADNYRQAIPLLIREGIPCTYFVTVGNVLEHLWFTHDLVMGNHFAPNTLEQLRTMAAAGIEIASHTMNHANLGAISDPEILHQEIVTAKEELEKAIGKPVRYFAFPYGLHANLNSAAFALAKKAGFSGACSAYGGYNFPGDDPFHLQRIPADETMIHLKNWVTLDPRKRNTQRFVYTKELSEQLAEILAKSQADDGAKPPPAVFQYEIPDPPSSISSP